MVFWPCQSLAKQIAGLERPTKRGPFTGNQYIRISKTNFSKMYRKLKKRENERSASLEFFSLPLDVFRINSNTRPSSCDYSACKPSFSKTPTIRKVIFFRIYFRILAAVQLVVKVDWLFTFAFIQIFAHECMY